MDRDLDTQTTLFVRTNDLQMVRTPADYALMRRLTDPDWRP
ncbi:hypothetical protein [Streptomyces goshikiensis]